MLSQLQVAKATGDNEKLFKLMCGRRFRRNIVSATIFELDGSLVINKNQHLDLRINHF